MFRDFAYTVRRSVHAYDIIPVIDHATVSKIPAVYAYDIIQTYGSAYASRRSVTYAYDIIAKQDSASVSTVKTVSALDVLVAATDLASAEGMITVLVPDYSLTVDALAVANRAVDVYDIIPIIDYGVVVKTEVIEAKDYVLITDYADAKKAPIIAAFDSILSDAVSSSKSYSPLFFTLFRRKVSIRYSTLNVLDFALADSATYSKSYSPLFFTLFRRRIPVRYLTLAVDDSMTVADSASMVKTKVVGADDYVLYDYVPHVPPDEIRYRSLYANVGMRTVSVFDRITPHESVWVGPRAAVVHARDYLASDGASVLRRSVNAHDVLMSDNVNIVRIT